MEIHKNEHRFPSTTGVAEIYARSWTPANPQDVKAIFQIAHGMAEHGDRYDDFAKYLCTQGFAVYIDDHVGHGKSVTSKEDYGYFGERDGWMGFVNDCKLLTDLAREEYPGRPVIFFGHSMGSFIARLYAEKYGADLQAAIFCGTSGNNPAVGMGLWLANVIAKSRGSRSRSELLDRIAFGSYNKRITPQRTEKDWLTRDEAIVDQYLEDEACGFVFTAAGFRDMFQLLKAVSARSWYESLRKDLPLLLIAGQEDPVGAYGKGIQQIAQDLKEGGHDDVDVILYPEDRHEILNELNRQQVYADITKWANEKIN